MSVKKEPSGRRSVQVEVEVKGTPEQVWQAIASGPGISAWFVPTKLDGRVGGTVESDFGGGMVSSATITEWQPPRRLVVEDKWLQGGPPVATEWSVEAKRGGTCIVRVVHSLFASTDDWDGQLESTEHGWPGYFRVLRHYLEHHAGEAAASFVFMVPAAGGADAIWNTLSKALGTPAPRVGQQVRVEVPDGAAIAGTVQAIDHLPQGKGLMLVLDEPAPGIVLASAMDCMGMQMATLQAFYYGPRAGAAAAQQECWQRWLLGIFPAVAVTPPAP
jgi:uncharacterized protein YndB with AHSA1/START domain